MPLIAAVLQDEILKFTDAAHPSFIGFPENDADVALKWTNALKPFFATMVPPLIPGTTDLAAAAMQGAMAGASAPGAFLPLFASGLAVFYTTLVAGALPNLLVPPPAPYIPPVLPPLPNATPPAVIIASTVFAWASTGLWAPPPLFVPLVPVT